MGLNRPRRRLPRVSRSVWAWSTPRLPSSTFSHFQKSGPFEPPPPRRGAPSPAVAAHLATISPAYKMHRLLIRSQLTPSRSLELPRRSCAAAAIHPASPLRRRLLRLPPIDRSARTRIRSISLVSGYRRTPPPLSAAIDSASTSRPSHGRSGAHRFTAQAEHRHRSFLQSPPSPPRNPSRHPLCEARRRSVAGTARASCHLAPRAIPSPATASFLLATTETTPSPRTRATSAIAASGRNFPWYRASSSLPNPSILSPRLCCAPAAPPSPDVAGVRVPCLPRVHRRAFRCLSRSRAREHPPLSSPRWSPRAPPPVIR